jgi:hypothetical protein
MALSNQVTQIQSILANIPLPTLISYLQLVSVIEGTVANSSGTVTIGGVALTNYQYFQLGEVLGIVW